jgi:hypothetical protein
VIDIPRTNQDINRKIDILQGALEVDALQAAAVASGTDKYPELSTADVRSICSPKYKKDHFGNKNVHAFWGRTDCGLILSSISPWELKVKQSGVTRGGWACKACQGFWRQGRGASRFVQLVGDHRGTRVNLQLILDEPPQQLYNDWVKSRLEYYKRVEPTAAPRDVALEVDKGHTQRLKFIYIYTYVCMCIYLYIYHMRLDHDTGSYSYHIP